MNGYLTERELPELSDDQIKLLDSICKAVPGTSERPFAALFYQYDKLSQEQGIDTSRDNAVYRWMLRVGEKSKQDHEIARGIGFVPYLRSLLAARGITVVDDDENEDNNVTIHSNYIPNAVRESRNSRPNRRVSFDDARLEETWLSGPSQFEQPQLIDHRYSMLNQPPRRPREVFNSQRARSASSERHPGSRKPALKHFQDASPSSEYAFEYEEPRNPTLFFQPSFTQLEQNAEAFRAMSELRNARRHLHSWHDQAQARQLQDAQAYNISRLQVLRELLETWRGRYQEEKQKRERQTRLGNILKDILEDHQRRRNFQLLDRSFSHWHGSAIYQVRANEHTRKQLLRKRYFTRWRNLAVENTTKARSLLTRRYLKLWRETLLRRALVHDQADAHYEETLERRSIRKWLWVRCINLGDGRHDVWIQRAALRSWFFRLNEHRTQEHQAERWRNRRLVTTSLQSLVEQSRVWQQTLAAVQTRYNHKIVSQCVRALRIQATLSPLVTALSDKIATNLKTTALRVWKLHLTIKLQAAEVDRKRILQSAWTAWNDKLRCKALAQRIDQRVMVDNLRKWVLRSRAGVFRCAQNQQHLGRTFTRWKNSTKDREQRHEQALSNFADGQRWRRLKFSMLRLNIAMRNREDAERAAVEFSNSAMLPDVLAAWKQRTEHARKLAKWATDARFYVLCTRSLQVWRERTMDHKHQRRREAYAQVRAAVKARIVRKCLACLSDRIAELRDLDSRAAESAQTRLFNVGTTGFDTWRNEAARVTELKTQSVAVVRAKLLSSALSTTVTHHKDLEVLEQRALLFRQQAELGILASTLKKMQWVTFTAARQRESAEALWKRNQNQHMKYLLRYWASQAARQRVAKVMPGPQDPDSPSLRPASRAASKSAERLNFASSPPAQTNTPAYMRTPSRSRRTGRFRPLPTPVHVTPMTFHRGYSVTTPGPLESAPTGEVFDETDETGVVFDVLTPQITPFSRKLRASGVIPAPPSALRSSTWGKSMAGTGKSVRFAGPGRFSSGHHKLNPTA